jgi:peptidoglycan DL-endopeptidase LytE
MRIAAWIGVTIVAILAVGVPARADTAYTVLPHDTMYRIARRFGISIATLAAANGLRDPGRIRAGAVIIIPAAPVPSRLPRVPVPKSRSPVPDRAISTTAYVVRPGDTLYRLARSNNVTVAALAEANFLIVAEPIRVGQLLRIPARPALSQDEVALRPAPPLRDPIFRPAPVFQEPIILRPTIIGGGTLAPEGNRGRDGVARHIISSALGYLGTPYVFGGTSRSGVDCSGLVYLIYGPYVPHLPRLSYDQWAAGIPVTMENLAPGDLVFFNTDGSGASHVGIYIGDGQFVHPSTGAGRVVIDRLAAPYYAARYLGARRLC